MTVRVVETGLRSWQKPEPQWCHLCCCDCTADAVVIGEVRGQQIVLCREHGDAWLAASGTPSDKAAAIADLRAAAGSGRRRRQRMKTWERLDLALADADDDWGGWSFRGRR